MSFVDLEFLLFLPTVLILFYAAPSRYRPHVLLIASAFMYGWYRVDYLALLLVTTSVDYYFAILIDREVRFKKAFLLTSITLNLLILFIFKYLNFFAVDLLGLVAPTASSWVIKDLILPLGISFYTFHAISYLIDVYYKRVQAIRNPIIYYDYILFFPQLVAGPISRCSQLAPQLTSLDKKIEMATLLESFWLILWGYFLKVVIADNIAHVVDVAFNHNPNDIFEILLAGSLFSIQIYADFFGYSLIAIGIGKLFMVELPSNFNHPYMSVNVIEFWRRWHITLGTWIRDYVYIPLGGSKGSLFKRISTPLIVFAIFGLWHGADFKFLIWGIVNGILLSLNHFAQGLPIKVKIPNFFRILSTYLVICVTWVIFRAPGLDYLSASVSAATHFGYKEYYLDYLWAIGVYALPIVAVEYFQIRKNTLYIFDNENKAIRGVIWGLLLFLVITYFPTTKSVSFIYFQF